MMLIDDMFSTKMVPIYNIKLIYYYKTYDLAFYVQLRIVCDD